jgi:hypothetical protein
LTGEGIVYRPIRHGVLIVLLAFAGGDLGARPPEDRIAALIKQLGDDDFERREAASKALDRIGEEALPELRRAAKGTDAEVRRRAEDLIQAIGERVFVEVRRFAGHTDGVVTVAISPDGRRARSGSWGGGATERSGSGTWRPRRKFAAWRGTPPVLPA